MNGPTGEAVRNAEVAERTRVNREAARNADQRGAEVRRTARDQHSI